MAYLHTPAYDSCGTKRPLHRLDEGDIVEWKRQGQRGSCRGRVTALVPGHKRPIRILPYTAQNEYAGRERWIGAAAVLRIYDRSGARKHPLAPEWQTS